MLTVEREKVAVSFAGPGAGTAPMTWGQKALWRDLQAAGLGTDLTVAHVLSAGATVRAAAAQLSKLMDDHAVLRMRLITGAGASLCQEVFAGGETTLEVLHLPSDATAGEAEEYVNTLSYEWMLSTLDLRREWPVRMTVIEHRGALRYRVCAFSHLITDVSGLGRLLARLPRGGEDSRRGRPGGLGILDLARQEQAEPSRRISDRAVRYWEAQLRSAPPLTFGDPVHPEGRLGHRYWHGQFSSPAAHLGVLAIAERTRTDPGRVLHAVIATAIARATGVNPLTIKVTMSNRFRPGLAEVVAPLSQDAAITVDVADATFDDVVARVRRASLVAGMHAYYDPDQLDEAAARLAAERGQPARVTCRFNDSRVTGQPAGDAARVTPAQIRRKLPETRLSWDGTLPRFHEQAWITVLDFPETVCLQVIFDMACLTEAQAEALLRGVEEVAVEAAFDASAPTRVGRRAVRG